MDAPYAVDHAVRLDLDPPAESLLHRYVDRDYVYAFFLFDRIRPGYIVFPVHKISVHMHRYVEAVDLLTGYVREYHSDRMRFRIIIPVFDIRGNFLQIGLLVHPCRGLLQLGVYEFQPVSLNECILT